MKDLLSGFTAGRYQFKSPWQATERSLTIIVPIVAQAPQRRDYVVLEEVKDNANIRDTGGINRARVEGFGSQPTFIRGGTMLKGPTQARATQFGIVVFPQRSTTVPVHCIHASRRIHPGTQFHASGFAPPEVYATILFERNQQRTWSEVKRYSTRVRAQDATQRYPVGRERLLRLHSPLSWLQTDDLVGNIDALHAFRKDLEKLLKAIPDYVDQVGAVVVDASGVLGLEVYDHPDSWKAFSKSIFRSYSEALSKEDTAGIFKPDMSAIIPTLHAFLSDIEKATQEEVYSQATATTRILKTAKYVGEYSMLEGKTMHLLVTRRVLGQS